jgi:hypothetical protein
VKLPDDWDAESGGGFFPYLMHLIHKPCGMRTGLAYDLDGIDPGYGEAAARRVVYDHTCEPED